MLAKVKLWNKLVGALYWDNASKSTIFEYDNKFLKSNLDIAPITMPLSKSRGKAYSFNRLPVETYKNLPAVFSDSLPDSFGNAIIDQWLQQQGKLLKDVNPVERLCYVGKRGMGALEYEPDQTLQVSKAATINVDEIVHLTKQILDQKEQKKLTLDEQNTINTILKVGSSAGGARAKVIVSINEEKREIIPGDLIASEGFRYWLLKLDGVTNQSLGDPEGFGKIEYAYHKIAAASGIKMTQCKLFQENNRYHFMTERFDRENHQKVHTQTLCGLAQMDYNQPLQHSYEQCFAVQRKLGLDFSDTIQQFRRMVFNVIAKNCDDHTKNITFLMDQKGQWKLSPAYDITYAHDPSNHWLKQHQMSVNGKRNDITVKDMLVVGETLGIRNRKKIIEEVKDGVSNWERVAKNLDIPKTQYQSIQERIQINNYKLPNQSKGISL